MNNRPIIKVPYQPIDIIVELINIALVLLIITYTIAQYFELPEIIPTHFNAKGIADDYGSKLTVLIIPAIAIFTYVLLFILTKYPHIHNYMVNITKENALKNYRFSIRVLRFVNLFCLLLFAYIVYAITQSAKGLEFNLGSWFIPIIIGVSILGTIFLFIYMKKLNKE